MGSTRSIQVICGDQIPQRLEPSISVVWAGVDDFVMKGGTGGTSGTSGANRPMFVHMYSIV